MCFTPDFWVVPPPHPFCQIMAAAAAAAAAAIAPEVGISAELVLMTRGLCVLLPHKNTLWWMTTMMWLTPTLIHYPY